MHPVFPATVYHLPSTKTHCTFTVTWALCERLPDVPVTVTVYAPDGVPGEVGGLVLLPPPQLARPRTSNKTAAVSVTLTSAR